MIRPPPSSTLFPYTTLFRSTRLHSASAACAFADETRARLGRDRRLLVLQRLEHVQPRCAARRKDGREQADHDRRHRSEEHTSELQSHVNLVCRLLLEKKKK